MTLEQPESANSETGFSASGHSVTEFIDGLRQGDTDAAQKIWERFLDRLIQLANRKLNATRKRQANEEDVVQVAFAQFFQQVESGRFPKLDDRHDLWQVLAMLVERRAIDQIRRNNSQRQGNGKLHGESVFVEVDGPASAGIAGTPCLLPTPELAVELTEEFQNRIEGLGRKDYRQIALLKMEGFTHREIAGKIGSSVRTVERRLEQIRKLWSDAAEQ